MQYMLLIYSADGSGPKPETPEFAEMMQGYFAFTEEIKSAGAFEAGQPLQGVETATTVRIRNGKVEHTDGPFSETKEILGGYYLLNCDNLDDALAYAAKIPTATYGSIEVRPIMELNM